MYGVQFLHPDPQVGNLSLRLPPTEVSWTFQLNTSVQDTVGGQVIQILSIGYENLVIQGQFGWEGPHGYNTNRNSGIRHERPTTEIFNLDVRGPTSNQPHMIGLTQMTQYFRTYFAAATQGGEPNSAGTLLRGQYNQKYMRLRYKGGEDDYEREWLVYPKNFPSYRRSNAEYAPAWRVEFEVVQPDFAIKKTNMINALKDSQLRAGIKYEALNPFSDPLADTGFGGINPKTKKGQKRLVALTQAQLDQVNNNVLDYYSNFIGGLAPDALGELINMNASLPKVFENELKKVKQ